ncbi:uncharacterized metal-binding protein YceD (DUF177 family) [Roseibium hamelinense]|uniref:Uncharacterized metal-binding protein YceD (DUF177 family) n=1 Tax=Roseibium hamelinense TaxID=150831 RepID=A0A562TGC2_9HYPH|nr:DUF177 domain-containing protein [Roseibium hamelinense]MTI46186.1 DUF177 domain-containing protein [Roseibium hamelinense]TWI92622.1 uncharacterized metal-binding protein YceD (DUF177 family) [Roseibium hamelinense]
MSTRDFPFSHKINAERFGDATKTLVVEPEAAALKKIAKDYGLADLKSLKAELTIAPWKKAGARVSGKISAHIVQRCVVSLEDFDTVLEDEVDRTFEAVARKTRRPRDLNADGEIEIELESLDPPDVMIDGVIDLGAVICEQLALSIDPFPRKPGAAFEAPQEETEADDAETPSPFAALAKLKPQGEA